MLAAEHFLGFDGIDLRLERIEGLRQIGRDVFPTLGPFEQDTDVVDLFAKAVALLEIFGEAGRHARSSVGVSELPLNIPVEIEIVVEVAP